MIAALSLLLGTLLLASLGHYVSWYATTLVVAIGVVVAVVDARTWAGRNRL